MGCYPTAALAVVDHEARHLTMGSLLSPASAKASAFTGLTADETGPGQQGRAADAATQGPRLS
jgi:hypothetical protein